MNDLFRIGVLDISETPVTASYLDVLITSGVLVPVADGDLLTRAEWAATIDVEDLIADLYGCLTHPHMGGDLDAKCARKVLAEHGIGGDDE
jgi:hypothetical protein